MARAHKKADIYRAELQSGMSCREIAERHGVSLQAVYAACGGVRNNIFRPYGEKECVWKGLRNWLNWRQVSRRKLLLAMGLEYSQGNLERLNQNLKGEKDLRMSFIRKMMDISGRTFEELFCGDNTDGKRC